MRSRNRPRADVPAAQRGPAYAPSGWFCAGWQMISSGDRAGLKQTLETGVADRRDAAERACLQAGALLLCGEVRLAAKMATKALAARADFGAPYVVRARALRGLGEHGSALRDFEQAAELGADDVELVIEQAHEHLALNALADARDCYQLALARAPAHPAALLGLARTLRGLGDTGAALEQLGLATRASPVAAEIQFEAAQLHERCDDLPAAVAAYQRGLELAPDNFAACANLGLLYLSRIGDPGSARRYFERALALEPGSVAAQANLGLALEEQGRAEEALAHYEKLIAAFPKVNEYRWNRGLALLGRGDFRRGWTDYEMRNALGRGTPSREFPFPAWTGATLPDGAALLVYAEQGLGDEIMFASCVADLPARGIDCVVECDPRLAGLFARSFPAATVHGAARDGDRRWLTAYPQVTAQCAIGSLPRLMRNSLADFPRHAGYLTADPLRVARWQARLKRAGTDFSVGLAWRGGNRGTRGDLRSIPLRELASILALPHLTLINLQRDAGADLADLAASQGVRILDFHEALDDVEEMAALCRALDRVVTVDNSVAHLAGALGCKAAVLLSHSADWRWMRDQRNSPWYPSITLYRQAAPGDWASALAQARAELAARP